MLRALKILLLGFLITAGVCWGAAEPAAPDGWTRSKPEEQGVDSGKLASMLRAIDEQQLQVDSLLIVRRGELIMETYGASFSRNVKQDLHTCTKSVTSALAGLMIRDGYFKGVDENMTRFFPEIAAGKGMERVAVKHLLSGTSGMEWHERPVGPVISQLEKSPDWVRFILERPVDDSPGTVFNDNSGAPHLISAAITKLTGKTALSYARENLFGPMGIDDLEWAADPHGNNIGGWGLKMRPVDFAKFGYLYLRKGNWRGKELIPAAWVEESTRKHVDTSRYPLSEFGFGYEWWTNEFGGYSALSDQGKYVFVIPEKDLVVVFTGRLDNDFRIPRSMVKYFILPAIKSERPLKPNPKAHALLNEWVHNP